MYAKSIEWLKRIRFFCGWSSDSAPRPPGSKLTLFLSPPMCRRSSFLTGEVEGGGGVWREAKLYDREKAWPSKKQSILSGWVYGAYLHCMTVSKLPMCTPFSLLSLKWIEQRRHGKQFSLFLFGKNWKRKYQKARKSDNNNCKKFYGGAFSIHFEKKKVVNFNNKVKLLKTTKILESQYN